MTTGKETLYKVLGADRQSTHGGSGTWEPGEWRAVDLPLIPCVRGLHVCALAHLPMWLGPAIWEVEVAGERIEHADKIVVERARITRPVETWNARTARLFAADCAEHVLPHYETAFPGDDRPRRAIVAARAIARGEITDAADAAYAAYAYAYVGTSTAWAAEAATWAAWAAVGAARSAAYAAWDANAERQWQADRLEQYLRGEIAR